MKAIKISIFVFLICLVKIAAAQEVPLYLQTPLKSDDTVKLATLVNKDNLNTCYGKYSVLSDAVRLYAPKCFAWLIAKGANVNLSCDGYVPPLMHAAKYGHLDMVKVLVAKGADINYKYDGPTEAIKGHTPLTYAEKFKQTDIADYLRSLKK